MHNAEILSRYHSDRDALDAACAALQQRLQALLAAAGIDVLFVSSRVKSRDSLSRKIARPDKTYRALNDVTDVVGVRIVCFFEDGISEVAKLIEDNLRVDFAHSTDKLRFFDHGKFGYRSVHYVCHAPDDALPGMRFEIQVRTALQHAWAEVEHDLGYKANDTVPDIIRRRFSRIASLLEIADQEFVSIRHDLRRYQAEVREELAQPTHELAIDVVTVDAFAHDALVDACDARIAGSIGRPRASTLYSPQYLVRLLRLAGFSTTAQIGSALTRHQHAVVDVVAPYFLLTQRLWGQDANALSAVPRGYCLFFLAHVSILSEHALGLSKVTRLARIYHTLDYPDDERTAQHVAGALVDAMADILARTPPLGAG